MISYPFSSRLRSFIAAGLILVQALLPCLVWSQAAAQTANIATLKTVAAGIVNSLSGDVFVRKPSGEELKAKPGDLIGEGSVIITRDGGEAILLFVDGQHIVLSENSRLRVDDYRFDPQNPNLDKASFGLLEGTMRIVTGAMHLANRNSLAVSAGDVRIGVLSNEVSSFVVETHTQEEQQTSFVATIAGEVSIASLAGPSITVPTDQFVRLEANGVITTPQPLAAAPAWLQAAGASRTTALAEGDALDLKQAAALAKLLGELPPTAAGQEALLKVAEAVLPTVTSGPGGGGGCSGTSPC